MLLPALYILVARHGRRGIGNHWNIVMVREPPPNPADNIGVGTVEDRLSKIERLLVVLVERQQFHDWYDIDEFARLVDKAPFTVREWARLGRIHATKRRSGRGAHPAWVVSHAELERYRREGLLPTPEGKPE